jgi:hypothetical protein
VNLFLILSSLGFEPASKKKGKEKRKRIKIPKVQRKAIAKITIIYIYF